MRNSTHEGDSAERNPTARINPPGPISSGNAAAGVTASAAAAATTTGWPVLTRTSLVHGQGAAFPILAIQTQDGGLGAFFGVHGRESETACAASAFVHDYVDFVHRAVLRQHVAEIVFSYVKG